MQRLKAFYFCHVFMLYNVF